MAIHKNHWRNRLFIGIVTAAMLISTAASPLFAQPPKGPRPGGPSSPRPWGPTPPPPRYRYDDHHHNDFGKTLAVIGAVGAAAAIANGMSRYDYYRRTQPVVIVPSQPSTVIIEKPVIVEKTVTVERPVVADTTEGTYSPKLGASFRIDKVQIPGNRFIAARLLSDPVEGSPLEKIGLQKGDVITRLDDNAADSLSELDRHEKSTLVRYIKTGTTKVLLANVYIPTESEVPVSEGYSAP
ncbi:MAG: hypothetical protein LBT46_07865 [Planctomycetaceae bacterium]|jgi:hypothetical protein|nr:hypothetical protein [Planctomycetaceae bacterium]